MKKIILLAVLVMGFSATSAFAYVDCRESTGCSIEQLVSLCQSAPTSAEDRVNACKEAITKIQEKIAAMSSAQAPSSVANTCLDLKNNLWIGKKDSETNGEVSKLQKFLIGYGFLNAPMPTGYYGQVTAQAVYRYQMEILKWNWVTVSSGVGPKTRAELAKVCSSDYSTFTGTYNWDSAGMTGLPDSFTPYGEVGTLHFVENQNQVRMKVFGTTTLPYSGSDSCSVSQENVKLRVSIVPPTGDIVVKDVVSAGTLSPRKCATQ